MKKEKRDRITEQNYLLAIFKVVFAHARKLVTRYYVNVVF